jgi:hypothetical protein
MTRPDLHLVGPALPGFRGYWWPETAAGTNAAIT